MADNYDATFDNLVFDEDLEHILEEIFDEAQLTVCEDDNGLNGSYEELVAASIVLVAAALSGLSTCPHCDSLRLKVLPSRVEVFSKVAPRPTPPHRFCSCRGTARGDGSGNVCDLDREDSAALEFSPFRRSPTECKKPA
ncbi:hypothetical protein G5714_017347 [Onychostoma macrolepis]|uniref:Uncharacterized protein n=1 Tax=Onychostoma macrolepis TaxID=369639 RepID=A0A7J6C5H0_9TELE|nr:hypothetical protein G5714_017347 [Onychostoma macrolepis]